MNWERNKWIAQPKQWDLLLAHLYLLLKAVEQRCGHMQRFRLMKIRKKSWIESRNISKIITILSYFSTVLMLSPTVLMLSLHSTEYPPQYWCYPPHLLMHPSTVLNNLNSTDAILHSTEQPPQYWCFPSKYWCYPPHVLMLSPCSTAAIPLQYWVAPP